MAWTDKYIGIPFQPNGRDFKALDCWGLACLIYKEEKNIILPDYLNVFRANERENLKEVAEIMNRDRHTLKNVDYSKRREFDIIILRSGSYIWHVGIILDLDTMIHVSEGTNVGIEKYTGCLWGNRIEDIRRPK